MIQYLLDTCICVHLIRRRPEVLLERLQQHEPRSVGLSSITVAELAYGVARSDKPVETHHSLARFLLPFGVLDFDPHAAAEYGRLRAALERIGRPIGPLDTLIAAHALSLQATLVTTNQREFARVPGLQVEDWTRRT